MGVPKFFRYISERYPCLSELAREQWIPDFDNLYLDMNGIIHNCSHPDDGNIHFSITEEDMFKDIFIYIEKLFFLIKPQRLFFMAVDGVAPRAKMNQQRSRRFRAAKDAETLSQQAAKRGEVIQNTPFDSNCITPGTEFMERLHHALRFFIKNKISTDSMWQKCRVILSGHDTPGEGEHKIMDYIRYMKSQKDFDPHTRHCLYGLDADLIILGLCTHELHFVVLREEVKFGRKTKRAAVEETRFFLLHLGLFREYLELEFSSLMEEESFSINKLIDDWVLMGFLVGNDFIPHLPCLHISSNALPLVYQTYMKVYPKLGGNINENGTLNLRRLEIFLEALSDVEFQIFKENYADLKYFDEEQSKNDNEAFNFDVSEILEESRDDDLAKLIESTMQFCGGEDDNSSEYEEENIFDEFRTYKRNYYIKKLEYEEMTPEVLREQSVTYVTALQWILHYYYKGVQSWGWYYPYHYAPFISDLKNFKDINIEFEMGKPFLPFEQLLGVLPAASRKLLPVAYQDLFISPNSEIIHFYPESFKTDLNGKKNEWEALVLIPFIDEKLLLSAMKKCESDLLASEVKRNSHGPMMQYDYTSQSQGECQSLDGLKIIYHLYCTEKSLWREQIMISSNSCPLVELESANRSVFFPGFPTMKHLKFTFKVKNARVKVFDYPARNESIILEPNQVHDHDDITIVAAKCLDKVVYIGWPHLIKAKVVSISNSKIVITSEGVRENNSRMFEMQIRSVREHLSSRMGIEIDECHVLVHVETLLGTSLSCGSQGKVSNNDVWSQNKIHYPAQLIVTEISVHNSCSTQIKKVENLFPVDSRVFFVGNPYFGSEGTVLNPLLVYECGRLKVNITVLPQPDFSEAKTLQNNLESNYLNTYQVQSFLGISTKVLLRLTASVLLIMGEKTPVMAENAKKLNIGLSMRFPKQNEELSGYSRKKENSWYFSQKAVDLIDAYYKKFPMVINFLTQTAGSSNYEFCYESDLFPDNVGERFVDEILTWMAEQEISKAERVPCGTTVVEKEAVEKVIESIEKLKPLPVKTVKLQVKPHLLMRPDVNLAEQYKPRRHLRMFDRVVVVRNTYLVPIGCRGTVIGILPLSDPNPVRLECVKQTSYFLEVIFDKVIPYGNSIYGIGEGRVVRVPETAVLVIDIENSSRNDTTTEKQPQTNENRTAATTQKPMNTPSNTAQIKIQQNPASNTPVIEKTPVNENHLKYPDSSISQTKLASKEDFWMPMPDSKKKNYNTTIAGGQRDNRNVHVRVPQNNILENDFNSGTDILKSMLGLQKTSTNEGNAPQQMPMIVNASQFPPPPTWRNNNDFTSNNNELMMAQPIPAVDQRNKNVPLQFYGQSLPHFAPQQQLPYVNDNFYSPVTLNQKGAFIPLQVMKTAGPNKPPQGSIDVGKIEEQIREIAIDAAKDSRRQNASAPNATAGADTLKQRPPQKASVPPKGPPKVSKIAARFDNM